MKTSKNEIEKKIRNRWILAGFFIAMFILSGIFAINQKLQPIPHGNWIIYVSLTVIIFCMLLIPAAIDEALALEKSLDCTGR